jgi:VWFA-related protein
LSLTRPALTPLLLLATLVASETWVYAQSPQPAPTAAAPTIHVYSRETIIDVLATDDKGQPVTGLTRDDFTIEEDGKPQSIRSFYEVGKTAPPAPARPLPPNTYTNAQSLPAKGPVEVFLVQRPVVDLAPPPGFFVPAAMLDYLRSMTLGTEVAIFSYCSVTGLELVQGFTTDGNAAAAAAARIQPIVGKDYRGPSEKIFHIAAMEQLAAYVAGIHGRKNLIWMQGFIPMMIDRDGGYEWSGLTGGKVPPPPDMSIVHRLVDLYEIFSREQIAIYPVDPNGIHALGLGTLMTQEIADQTGGTYDNTNDIKGEIAAIVARSSDLYTLSFVPTRPGEDSHFHTIKIVCRRSGVNLTYRTGYDDDTPRPPDGMLKADLPQGPMRLGALPTTQLLFDLEVEPTPPSSSDAYAAAEAAMKPANNSDTKKLEKSLKGAPYDVIFRFDPTQIGFSEGPDGKRTASLEFDLGAYDLYSNLIVARSQTIKLVLTPPEYDEFMKTPFRFYLPIPLPSGQLKLHAGLFDTVANTSGTVELPLAVPKK